MNSDRTTKQSLQIEMFVIFLCFLANLHLRFSSPLKFPFKGFPFKGVLHKEASTLTFLLGALHSTLLKHFTPLLSAFSFQDQII